MTTLIASDGYEYADLTQRILGEPLENFRNRQVRELRLGYEEGEVRAYIEAYDRARGAHTSKYTAGWAALYKHRTQPRSASRAGVTNPLAQTPAAVHAAH